MPQGSGHFLPWPAASPLAGLSSHEPLHPLGPAWPIPAELSAKGGCGLQVSRQHEAVQPSGHEPAEKRCRVGGQKIPHNRQKESSPIQALATPSIAKKKGPVLLRGLVFLVGPARFELATNGLKAACSHRAEHATPLRSPARGSPMAHGSRPCWQKSPHTFPPETTKAPSAPSRVSRGLFCVQRVASGSVHTVSAASSRTS